MKGSPVLILDVAHPPRAGEILERELDDALAEIRRSSTLRILKIIHGYGSTGRGGSTKESVENWLYRRRRGLRAAISGEVYGRLDYSTQQMRSEAGQFADPDLDAVNRGVTLVWVK
jgi:hypothetical protein